MKRRGFFEVLGSAAVAPALAGCSESTGSVTVEIDYDGAWSGAISEDGDSSSISGIGPDAFEWSDEIPDVLSVNAQKQEDGTGTLAVELRADGEVVDSEATDASYGVARVSATF